MQLIVERDKTLPQRLWLLSLLHLRRLRTSYGFAASDSETGLYAALFGRDSLWTLTFLLAALRFPTPPELGVWVKAAGEEMLLRLCELQGQRVEDPIEEQPGKIVHEFRESLDQRLLSMGIPFEQGRSYAAFDPTFLFVTTYHAFAQQFPESRIVGDAWPHVERALGWMERYADEDGDGLYEYRRRDPRNLLNQAWKDSFDAAVETGADVPPHPLAWIDVQGYAHRALRDAATLYAARGDRARATLMSARADALQAAVDARFRLGSHGEYAMALDGRKRPIQAASSNPGHALWGGAIMPEHEPSLAARLFQPDLMTPFGIRTLSAASPFYAPFAYHRGNIWPFDNGVLALGLLERGYAEYALDLMRRVGHAVLRLGTPAELYIALDRELWVDPEPANSPALLWRRVESENRNQAWSAAAGLFFAAALADTVGVTLGNA